MTVITLREDKFYACCWDIDIIIKRESWILLELDAGDVENIPHLVLLQRQWKDTIVFLECKLSAGRRFLQRYCPSLNY